MNSGRCCQTNRWKQTIFYAVTISAAWNGLYIFSALPGGGQYAKNVALTTWAVFVISACSMLPYLIFGVIGLALHVGNVNKARLAKIAVSFGIFALMTVTTVVIGARIMNGKQHRVYQMIGK